MARVSLASVAFLLAAVFTQPALATRSAELYSSAAYGYGRVEARLRFAGGEGVIGSFFLWKDGSEQAGTFWTELDFEKVGADCHLESNPLYGMPAQVHSQRHALAQDLCAGFHTYTYEWTPDHIAWLVDGVEIRRETGDTATAYATNASQKGMQIHFNIWPGDASFGGNFKPEILPVHEYVDWVQFSSYNNGTFTSAWREDFNGSTLPAGWLTGNWTSPKNLSTHDAGNVNVQGGFAILSMTADNAVGPAGAMPGDAGGGAGSGGSATTGGTAAGGSGTGGMAAGGSGTGGVATGGTAAAGGAAGGNSSSGGVTASGGNVASQSGAAAGGAAGTFALNDPTGPGGGANAAGTPSNGSASSQPSGSNGCALGSSREQRPELAWLSALALALLARSRKTRKKS